MARFGITTPMVSIVLSVFMAGLGIGSWAGGKFIRRFDRSSAAAPLRLYALLELIIGLSALIAPLMIDAGYNLLRNQGQGLAWGSSFYYLVSGGWILVSLLPWCTCMGATFPFAMAAIRKVRQEESERSFSYLYLANVLGAVLGTLVPAFVLIELFGFQGTLYVACALNGVLAVTVFLFSLTVPQAPPTALLASETRETVATRPGQALLWQLFTTGLCSMALEVIWIRQFTVYLGNVVYAFAVILALYLLATFIGSGVYRRLARSHDPSRMGAAWIPLGLLALLPLWFADPRFPIPEVLDTAGSLGLGAIRAALGIVPFSGLVGFLTMLVDRWSGGAPDRAGKAYAINVLGSILGPLLAGFCVLPFAGEKWGLCLISLPLFAIGFASAFRAPGPIGGVLKLRRLYGVTVALAILLAILTRDYDVKFSQRIELRDHTATVIASGEGMRKRLLVNGTGMTKLTTITKMMAHLPLAFLNRPAHDGLVICMGMGTTFRSMLSWGVNSTVVELVPSVPKFFSYFHPDAPELLRSGRAYVVVDDGRRFLERSPQKFDVIAIDPPPPIGAPTSSLLYSEEFYSLIKPHLRSGAILQVWCPGGDNATNSAVTKALQNSFPNVRGFDSIEGWGTHYLVSMQPIPGDDPKELARRLPPQAAQDLVEFKPAMTPEQVLAEVVDNEDDLSDIVNADRSVPPITDNRPINEYFLLRSMLRAK
jgi:spermidine synthase